MNSQTTTPNESNDDEESLEEIISQIQEGPKFPLGPHQRPRIECKKCGEVWHYTTALPEYGMSAHCPECSAFLPQPTEEQHRKFSWFLDWNTRHLERERNQSTI